MCLMCVRGYPEIKLYSILCAFALKRNLSTEKVNNDEEQKAARGTTLAYGAEIQVCTQLFMLIPFYEGL